MSTDRGTDRVRAASAATAMAALLILGGETPAHAEPMKQVCDLVAAKARFDEGKDLVDRGDWAAGCAKFEASMVLCAAASVQINVARCRAHDGKLAMALADYQKALVINRETPKPERRKALEELATKELAEITKRVPTLTITVRKAPPDLMVTRDASFVPANVFGEPVPVDVGKHVIIASASGFLIDRQRGADRGVEERRGRDHSDPRARHG